MPLTKEQIAELMALPKRRGGGGKRKSGIDTSVRDHQTWFNLAQKMVDEETRELIVCENPDCGDPREGGGIIVTLINGKYMCRYCFLNGWLVDNPEQQQLAS